jgi:hypothetical protein
MGKYLGVTKDGKKWKLEVISRGKLVYRNWYSTEERAAKEYDIMALHFDGRFARTNFHRPVR